MKITSLLLFPLFVSCSVLGDDFYRCPDGFKNSATQNLKKLYGNKCYLFVKTEEVLGETAIKTCKRIGGEPVEIPDEATNNFIINIIRNDDVLKEKNGIWIGLNDNSDWSGDGHWTWLASGRKLSASGFSNWASDEPSTGYFTDLAHDCVTMRKDDGYKWSDRNCKALYTHYYICQFVMGRPTTTTTTTQSTTHSTVRPTVRPTTKLPRTTPTFPPTQTTGAITTLNPKETVHVGDNSSGVKPGLSSGNGGKNNENDDLSATFEAAAAKQKENEGQEGGAAGEKSNNTAVGLGVGIGLGLLVVLIVVIFVVICRRRKRKQPEQPVVTFHNAEYVDGRRDNVYSDVDENQYTEMGGGGVAVGAEAPRPPSNMYSNCRLQDGDLSNKKNEVEELQRSENQYEVPNVAMSHYAVPSSPVTQPPPAYYPPGSPPPYAEQENGSTPSDPVQWSANDTYVESV